MERMGPSRIADNMDGGQDPFPNHKKRLLKLQLKCGSNSCHFSTRSKRPPLYAQRYRLQDVDLGHLESAPRGDGAECAGSK